MRFLEAARPFDAVGQAVPFSLADFGWAEHLPVVLAGLLALIAAATLLHALASTVRERRQDFAILKTLGFVRRQVRTTVAWQATTLAVLALALGIRLGAATGRWSWRVFANDLGIVPDSIVPVVFVLVTVVVAIVAANAVAGLPARIAARTRPASVLRSE